MFDNRMKRDAAVLAGLLRGAEDWAAWLWRSKVTAVCLWLAAVCSCAAEISRSAALLVARIVRRAATIAKKPVMRVCHS